MKRDKKVYYTVYICDPDSCQWREGSYRKTRTAAKARRIAVALAPALRDGSWAEVNRNGWSSRHGCYCHPCDRVGETYHNAPLSPYEVYRKYSRRRY